MKDEIVTLLHFLMT